MRVAIHQTGSVGARAGRVLLAERNLEELGLHGSTPRRPSDSRIRVVEDLIGYDVLVTDDSEDPVATIQEALDANINCIVWVDDSLLGDASERLVELGAEFASAGRTLVTDANLGHGLAPALAHHEMARTGERMAVECAWTEQGRPLRRGVAVPFPDPVGSLWGRYSGEFEGIQTITAPVPGEWGAALARVTSATDSGVATRVVGVSDLAERLEAISLAAAVIAVADGVYPPGIHHASTGRDSYLARALGAGLDIATYSES